LISQGVPLLEGVKQEGVGRQAIFELSASISQYSKMVGVSATAL